MDGWDVVGVVALVACFPFLLLGVVLAMAWLEEWVVRPEERGAYIAELVVTVASVEQVEAGVQAMAEAAFAERPSAAAAAIKD